jgi:PKD repeat protein
MKHMQVFAGIWAPEYLWPSHDFGHAELSDIEVTGYLGTSDPLVADFTYSPTVISPGDTIQFTDITGGGMPPYTYSWDFGDGSPTSSEQNPTHVYATAGSYTVELTVTPFRCVPKSVTKTIVASPGTGTPGYWMTHPDAWPVEEITIGGETYTKAEAIELMLNDSKQDVTYNMFQALVAAKLNVLIGNDDSCIAATIADADAWMATYGPVGSGVKAGGKDSPWREGAPLFSMLQEYNNGYLCAPHRS